jgi:hypothetical protein
VRQLVVRLTLAAAATAVVAVLVAAAAMQLAGDRARLRADTEADAAALVSLVEVTADEEVLLRGMARTAAGADGRLAVHLGPRTVGTSRVGPVPVGHPDEVALDGGTVLLRVVPSAPDAVVEAYVPPLPIGPELARLALLLVAGAVGALIAVLVGLRRVRPVVADLAELTERRRATAAHPGDARRGDRGPGRGARRARGPLRGGPRPGAAAGRGPVAPAAHPADRTGPRRRLDR